VNFVSQNQRTIIEEHENKKKSEEYN